MDKSNCGIGAIASILGNRSNQLINKAIMMLKRMEHRGGMFNDNTGDGCGILTNIPDKLFRSELSLPEEYAVAMIFINKDIDIEEIKDYFIRIGTEFNCDLLTIRKVPVDNSVIGIKAKASEPNVYQFFITKIEDKQLFILRRLLEKTLYKQYKQTDVYISSLSASTIVYKGLLTPDQLGDYYQDLKNPLFTSAVAIVHQRFSTNTSPTWDLAQPFRYLAHNGEINTINGNINWMNARHGEYKNTKLGNCFPVTDNMISDSSNLDRAIEFYLQQDLDFEEIVMRLVPPAYEMDHTMNQNLRAVYQDLEVDYEPWDGPAALVMTDGKKLVATLDRNGLRPSRYIITKDNEVILSSEVGVLDIAFNEIVASERLEAGKVLTVDLVNKCIYQDQEIKNDIINKYQIKHNVNLIEPKFSYQSSQSEEQYNNNLMKYRYTKEDIKVLISDVLKSKKETIGSFPYSESLAYFNKGKNLLFDYFKQQFAQVTNPPLDSIREAMFFSTNSYLKNGNSVLKFNSPMLMKNQYDLIVENNCVIINNSVESTYKEAIMKIEAFLANQEANTFVITDTENDQTLPILLLTSIVHHQLIEKGIRTNCQIVVASKEIKEVSHMAMLLAYGADLIYPYQVYEIIERMDVEDGFNIYYQAVSNALTKIMSKMGISSLSSFRGSKIYEAVGLDFTFVEKYFPNTKASINGKKLEDIEADYKLLNNAYDSTEYRFYQRSKGFSYSPQYAKTLLQVIKNKDFKQFKVLSEGEENNNIRDAFTLIENPISLESIESVESIYKRFVASAMSYGALSEAAHMNIAQAFNEMGASSNSGEGGEDTKRFNTNLVSKVKQVSSGRFGVTTDYLLNCDEIQIKVAQGAKPGEGGHLPAHKVSASIAAVRNTLPGIDLISPPPHHDIYSIEDLAQLIYDLRQVNPKAKISVKLASLTNVGIIAVGVVKAGADKVVISGFNSGTGAAPISSLKYTGLPLEIGLKEAHDKLTEIGIRKNVIIQADGQIRSGEDVIKLALLGADEFGFATNLLISLGCIACRNCHTNKCPKGICTQDEKFTANFSGHYNDVKTYLSFVAREVQEYLAKLGVNSLKEIIGRVDLINEKMQVEYRDLLEIKSAPDFTIDKIVTNNEANEVILNEYQLGKEVIDFDIKNINRTFGASIAANKTESNVVINTKGYAGQSYGAFIKQGTTLNHFGLANDYVGKGLCGGEIIITSPKENLNIVAGNTLLYGATSGDVFINGRVGERFAVRNSGANAVIEGCGKHGCEYMTGGIVACLDTIDLNFGAGMSGGIAFILKNEVNKINNDSVEAFSLNDNDEKVLKNLITNHYNKTKSTKAYKILNNDLSNSFVLIAAPKFYNNRMYHLTYYNKQ